MREFVNFAQDAVANNAKNTIARLGKRASSFATFPISAAADGDSVGKLRRSADSKRANNTVRTEFRNAVAKMFGGADRIPPSVLVAMNIQDYEKGKPLTADRILDVYAAIKNHISGLKNAAIENGTLRAIDVADTTAELFVDKFQEKHNIRLSATVASNLKRALLLCAANVLDDNAVKDGEAAVRKFVHPLNDSFKYTLKALGFDPATRKVSIPRIENLMKDEVHMRGAVFALLDKDGNVDVNHFDARLAIFNDEWLKHESSGLIRPNLDSPGPAAVKALQAEFTRTARVKVGDWARKEIDAFFKANPDKIPAAIRNDKREAQLYVGLVQKYITSKGENEAKNWGQKILQSISERSSAYEIAKAFAGMFAEFRKLMPDENYNDRYDRAEHNACLKFFTGVAMAGLNQNEKVRMTMIFATEEAKIASNTMQTLEQDGGMDPAVKWDLQDMTYLMRSCTSFLADDLSLDADAFAVNQIIETMKIDTLPDDVVNKFSGLLQIQK